jgi:Heterokaryon incompatibility protein (HET)
MSGTVVYGIGIGHALYLLATYLDQSSSRTMLFYAVHAFVSWIILKPSRFATGLYKLSVGDGTLDEWLNDLIEDASKLATYVPAFCVVYNIFGIWNLIKFIFLYLSLPGLLAVVVLYSSSTAKWLFAAALPITTWCGRMIFLCIFKAVVLIYRPIAASCRWTGWFVDMDPIDNNVSQYEYCKLPTDRTIRLLLLSRKYPWGPLQLELYPYGLGECPPYEAISYTWGDASNVCLITIDGGKLEVSANAFQIISRRASYWNARFLWIDSVCIDQGNLEERSKQIQLMRELYRNASRVIVWLGEAPQPLPAIPAFLAFTFLLDTYRAINYSNLSDDQLKAVLKVGTKQPGWQTLFEILCNPFWRRIWVIQEIVVGTKVQLYYGGLYFNWEVFAATIGSLQGSRVGSLFTLTGTDIMPSNMLAAIEGRDQILFISQFKEHIRQVQSIPLSSLLYSTYQFLSTNPRDRVYALLGMSDIGTDSAIIPDYKQDVSKLLLSTSRYLLTHETDPFRSLHRAGIGYKRRTENIPSWVVDWNARTQSKSLWNEPSNFPYEASKGHGGHLQIDEASRTICVSAFQFDEIKNYGPARELNLEAQCEEFLLAADSIRIGFRDTCTLAEVDSPELYKTGINRTEALWRCLVGDRNRTTHDRPANRSIGESFYAARRLSLMEVLYAQEHTLEEDLEAGRRIYPERQWRSDEEAGRNIDEEQTKTLLFSGAISNAFGGRKLANTRSGYYAMVPPLAEVGDIICLIDGAQTPFVLRRDSNGLQLVGECYVHGVMDGEIAGDGVREMFVLH